MARDKATTALFLKMDSDAESGIASRKIDAEVVFTTTPDGRYRVEGDDGFTGEAESAIQALYSYWIAKLKDMVD